MSNFDPLKTEYSGIEEVVIKSPKREIQNILISYVGWFDPFCELIQNTLDSVEERSKLKEKGYFLTVMIMIDLANYAVLSFIDTIVV